MDVHSAVRHLFSGRGGGSHSSVLQFSTLLRGLGGDITYDPSGADQGSFKINSDGVYAVSFSFQTGPVSAARGEIHGQTVVGNTSTNPLAQFDKASAETECAASWTGYLRQGEKVWVTTNVTPSSGSITIARVG